MKRNNTEGKGWLAAILIVMILCGMMAMVRAEAATSTDTGETKPALEITGEMAETAGVSDVSSDLATGEAADMPTPTPENTEPSAADPTATPEAPAETPAEQPSAEPTSTPDLPAETPTEQPTQPPEETDPPADLKTLFDVDVKVPSAWRSDAAATVRLKITPTGSQMWHTVRVRQGDADWQTIRNKDFVLYEGYYYTDIEVGGNARMTVRLYGDEQNYFDTNKEIRLFDRHAPEVTAGFRDRLLHVEAADDLSGVAGIQVNSLLFTTLVDGVLDVRMEEPLQTYRQLAIRAYDYAGNFSAPVTLDSPYYMAPTPEPTQTPRPTAKPTKKPSGNDTRATATPAVTAAPATQQPQIVYVTPDPALYSYTRPATTPEPETVYVPLGPGQPYKSKGNMQTLDMLYSASTNKQFITVQTRAGETYYMVIDYDKPIDADNDIYETYFLNLVDDRDLLSVVSEEEIKATPTPQIVYVTPEPTQSLQQTAPIVVEGDGMAEMLPVLLLLVGAAAVGGAVFWFVRQKKNSAAQAASDLDEAYDFDEDEEDTEE